MVQRLLHYEVLELLGEGARSTIYSVVDPQSRKLFALKHVVRKEQKDIRFIEQMETEYEISRQFTHRNLRRSYELKLVKTLLLKVSEAFLIMELFDGRPLDVAPPTNMMQILDIFIQSAQGLKVLHQMGYIHCDLKPNNILRNDAGDVKIIDFGQSCAIGTDAGFHRSRAGFPQAGGRADGCFQPGCHVVLGMYGPTHSDALYRQQKR
jgi:serine/threonine-protein kinase